MIGKIAAILLLCVSVFLYMTNTQIVENLVSDNPNDLQDSTSQQTGGALEEVFGDNGYYTANYFPISGTRAYEQGGTDTIDRRGPQFITRARLGLNAARGGDAILCNGKMENQCRGDSSCVWADPGVCKNTFNNLNQSYDVQGYVEKQFQNGTMGAPYIKDQMKRKANLNNYTDDNDESNGVEAFGVKNNTTRTRSNETKVQNARRGDIVGALRGEVKITQNKSGYCPSMQISKTLGGGQTYSCSAITGVGSDNDPLWKQSEKEKSCNYKFNCKRN